MPVMTGKSAMFGIFTGIVMAVAMLVLLKLTIYGDPLAATEVLMTRGGFEYFLMTKTHTAEQRLDNLGLRIQALSARLNTW